MKRFILARDACRELSEISDYFLAQNVDAGERFVEAFDKKCQHLARFPYLGKSYTHVDDELRGTPLMGYIIFYQLIDDGIEILRVVSGYRDLSQVFDKS